MKDISSSLKTHLEEETTTLVTCWKLSLTDGTVFGFTDHDSSLTFESQLYEAKTGFTPSAVASNAELSVDNLNLEGVLDSAFITEEDIQNGRYDAATIEIFMVNSADLTQGRLWLRSGTLGNVTLKNGQFEVEVRGLLESFTKTIGDLYSPLCRATFGKCGVNLEDYTVTGTITDVTSNQVFADSMRTEEAGYFSFGTITFTSGANEGRTIEVKRFDGGTVTTVLPLPYNVAIGDSYSMVAGCDRTFESCVAKFDNAVDFRGEPHVPGADEILKTSGTFR